MVPGERTLLLNGPATRVLGLSVRVRVKVPPMKQSRQGPEQGEANPLSPCRQQPSIIQ